jgi:hypothetical protein
MLMMTVAISRTAIPRRIKACDASSVAGRGGPTITG